MWEENKKRTESEEWYKKEQEAKERFFTELGGVVLKEFYGAAAQDVIDFAEKLKEWALTATVEPSPVEKWHLKALFYTSKLKN